MAVMSSSATSAFAVTPCSRRWANSVNVAARLQDLTKNLDCQAIVSEDVCKSAGIALDALTRTEVAIRGRDEPMIVRTAADPTVFASLLDPQSDPDEPQLSEAAVQV